MAVRVLDDFQTYSRVQFITKLSTESSNVNGNSAAAGILART